MLYINGRFLTRPMTGVERYAYNMCKAMAENHLPFTIICPHSPIQECYNISILPIIKYGYGSSHFWEQCILPFFFINKKNYMIICFTGLGSIFIRNKIMTIHDLSFLENPKWFSRSYFLWYKLMTPIAVKTSKHIITVSEYSKREIMRFYPFLKSQNISIIHNATDKKIFYSQPKSSATTDCFVLAVSSLDPRKNFNRLIEAFSGISNCKLYIVGARHHVFTKQDNNSCGQDNIYYLGRVTDEELASLYNQAVCFIFPSLYEGFGLPPLEAMSCGCPVLASDIPVIREVCGEAVLYFDPYNVNDIKRAITQYLNESDVIKEKMRQKGFSNILRFSWEESVQELAKIIEEVWKKQKDCE